MKPWMSICNKLDLSKSKPSPFTQRNFHGSQKRNVGSYFGSLVVVSFTFYFTWIFCRSNIKKSYYLRVDAWICLISGILTLWWQFPDLLTQPIFLPKKSFHQVAGKSSAQSATLSAWCWEPCARVCIHAWLTFNLQGQPHWQDLPTYTHRSVPHRRHSAVGGGKWHLSDAPNQPCHT